MLLTRSKEGTRWEGGAKAHKGTGHPGKENIQLMDLGSGKGAHN
jgi:hypothetical protein